MKKFILLSALFMAFSVTQAQTTPKKYNGKIAGGSVIFGIGVNIIGATVFAENYKPISDNLTKQQKPLIAAGYSTGAVFTVGGAILLGIGLNERKIYWDNKQSVSLIATDRIGIAYTF